MAFFGLFNKDVLYFPGCHSSAFNEPKIKNWERILKKLGVSFWIAEDFVCCGGFFEENGYEKELRKLARENLNFLKEKGVKKIITSCALCFETFKSYKNIIPEWDIEVEFILTTILNKIKEGDYVRNSFLESVAYYDSCQLGRYAEITNEPREILKLIGFHVIELPKNKEETLCCGSCGSLPITNQELADDIAFNFIRMLRRRKIKRLVTADARAYQHLKENFRKLGVANEEIELIDFSEIVCDGLGLKKE